jgi:predicted MFS family arabinose efflux permease
MLSTQGLVLISSAAMSLLLITGAEEFWHAYPAAMIVGISWALDMPSRRSAMHDLLGSSGVANAIALDAVGMSASRMAGPALAGVLIAVAGLAGAYLAVTVSVALSGALLFRFSVRGRARGMPTNRALLAGLAAGLRHVADHRILMATVVVTVIMNLLMYPYMHLVPVIARDVLHVGPVLMGVLMASDGLGSLVGAVLVAGAAGIRHHWRLFLGGSALALFALLLFSLSKWYLSSVPIMLLLGVGGAGFATMQGTIVILAAREDMRGKALGVVSLAIGASPFGALLEGAVAGRAGPSFALGLNASAGLVCIALIGLLLPSLMHRPLSAWADQAPRPN